MSQPLEDRMNCNDSQERRPVLEACPGNPDGVRWAEGAHSGWLSAGPAIRYGVSNPSYMR